MTNFSVQTINPVKIEDYYLIRSDQCGVKEMNSQMLISDEELKGKVGEGGGVQNFFDTLYEKPILLVMNFCAFCLSVLGLKLLQCPGKAGRPGGLKV